MAEMIDKREWLPVLPKWHGRWHDLLDRHLRNDVGHAEGECVEIHADLFARQASSQIVRRHVSMGA